MLKELAANVSWVKMLRCGNEIEHFSRCMEPYSFCK